MKKKIMALAGILVLGGVMLTSCNSTLSEYINLIKEANEEEVNADVNYEINDYCEDYTELYGYQSLQSDTKYGSYLTDVYETFYEAAYSFLTDTNDYPVVKDDDSSYVVIDEYRITSTRYIDLVASSWITMIEENPIFYFTFTGYTVNQYDGYYTFCFLASSDYATYESRANANNAIISLTEDFMEEYNNLEDNSDYSKAKFINDYICNTIDYAFDEDGNASTLAYDHNILGLLNGSGVCECYAESYLYLSYRIDLESLIVLGYSSNVGHAWNYVKVDDVWYGLDVTWNDEEDEISYDYFLASSRIMSQGHTANTNREYGIDYQVELPELSDSSYDTSLDENVLIPTPSHSHGGYKGRFF